MDSGNAVERTPANPQDSVLSYGEERLRFLHELAPDSPTYHVPTAFRLRGPLDARALENALSEVIARHEVLRTCYPMPGGRPVAAVCERAAGLEFEDLSAVAEPERAAAEAALLTRIAREPFDLATGPVLRATLIRQGPEEHVFVLVVHHITSDAAALGVLLDELAELYRARCLGIGAELPKVGASYRGFAAWERSSAPELELAEQLGYWRDCLKGAPDLLALPTDRPRPPRPSGAGDVVRLRVPGELAESLRSFARAAQVTPFAVALAGWASVLGDYAGVRDVVVAVPVESRSGFEFERTVGYFGNTLPLRIDLGGDPTFLDLTRRCHEVCLSGYENSDVPFERIVDATRTDRDVSRTPLAQVLLAWQENAAPAPFHALEAERVEVSTGTAKLDLSLYIADRGDHMEWTFEYSTDLFDAGTVRAVGGALVTRLAGALAEPGIALGAVGLVSAADEARVVQAGRGADVSGVQGLVHEVVGSVLPGVAVALRCDGTEVSGAELWSRAWGVAELLREAGVGPEVRVGVCAERSIELIVGLLGVLCAGGCYVPLDPDYPAERLGVMVRDASAHVVLAGSQYAEKVGQWAPDAQVMLLEDVCGGRADAFDSGAGPQNLAYVIYTSGSTGVPKGVGMPHAPLTNLLAWQVGRSTLPKTAPTVQFPALGFDMSFLDIFYTLAAGRTLVLAPARVRRDPSARADFFAEQGAGCFVLSPTALVQQASSASATGDRLPGVREFISAGEQLRITPDIQAMFADDDGRVLVNQYGPTETHCMTAYELTAPAATWPDPVPIGRPIANTCAYVLDALGRQVPDGMPGELYLGGGCVARGYLGRPALTAQRFVPDPYSPLPGARMYRTGDLARRRADGALEYLARLDEQVKIRGFRVEPGEVEAVLVRHPAVQQAAVVARTHGPAGEPVLVAYVRGRHGPVGLAGVRDFLGEKLPEYLIPAACVDLEAFPMTPSGKIDRRSLPAPAAHAFWSAGGGTAPEQRPGGALRTIARVWSSVLESEQIAVTDNFFEAGGSSFQLTRLKSELDAVYPGGFTLVDLLSNPTIAAQARFIEREAAQVDVDEPVPAPSAGQVPSRPGASALQARRALMGRAGRPD